MKKVTQIVRAIVLKLPFGSLSHVRFDFPPVPQQRSHRYETEDQHGFNFFCEIRKKTKVQLSPSQTPKPAKWLLLHLKRDALISCCWSLDQRSGKSKQICSKTSHRFWRQTDTVSTATYKDLGEKRCKGRSHPSFDLEPSVVHPRQHFHSRHLRNAGKIL